MTIAAKARNEPKIDRFLRGSECQLCECAHLLVASTYQRLPGVRTIINALKEIEVLTLFVADLNAAKRFYSDVFGCPVVFEDDVSSVMQIGPIMINLLLSAEAPELVAPKAVADPKSPLRALLTIKVADVDAVCRDLQAHQVSILNGPTDQPWGRRTAAFEDPDGNVWEVAQDL